MGALDENASSRRAEACTKKILVIEDEADLAELVAVLLQLRGYEVEVAHDGEDGLAKIRAQRFDLLITDLMMPIVSGWEVLEELGQSAEHRDIPVIVMSAAESRTKTHTYGHAFIAKPFPSDALLAMIAGLIGSSDS